MYFNYPVNQNAPHSFCNVRLILHIFEFCLIVCFGFHVVLENISSELGNMLWIICLIYITIFYGLHEMILNSLQEILVYLLHLFTEILLLAIFDCWRSGTWTLRFCSHVDDRNLWSISPLYTVNATVLDNCRNAWSGNISLCCGKSIYILFVIFLFIVTWRFLFESLICR